MGDIFKVPPSLTQQNVLHHTIKITRAESGDGIFIPHFTAAAREFTFAQE